MRNLWQILTLAAATLMGCGETKRQVIENFNNVSVRECVSGTPSCVEQLLHDDSTKANACFVLRQGDTSETISIWFPPDGGVPLVIDGETSFEFSGDGNVVVSTMYFVSVERNCGIFTHDTNCAETAGCLGKLSDTGVGEVDFVSQGLCSWELLPQGCSMNPRWDSTDGGYDGSDYDSGNHDIGPKPDTDIDGYIPDAGDATVDGSVPDVGPTECQGDEIQPCGEYFPGGCNPGVRYCYQGRWSANCIGADIRLEVEVCNNGRDDDCNGVIDDDPEGLCAACDAATLGQMCNTGLQGQCSQGSNVCVAGVVECQQWMMPAPQEWCNSIDDDCDGETDEDATQDIGCGLNWRGRMTLECIEGQLDWNGGHCVDPDNCIDGNTENRACGLNRRGNESRTCADGQWGMYNECVDPDICRDGDTEGEACDAGGQPGTHERVCAGGHWDLFGQCQVGGLCGDGDQQNRPCGFNERGLESRTCAGGLWADWGDCTDPDMCRDGDNQNQACGLNNRGSQSRTCTLGNFPDFGACVDPDQCTDGANEDQACGPNNSGTSSRTCNVGRWSPFGACMGADECVNGANEQRNCGLNSRGSQSRSCVDGNWSAFGVCADPDECTDDNTEEEPCGVNGTGRRSRTCVNGQWGAFGQCVDDANCQNGQTDNRPCGINNRGTEERTCNNGQWGNFGACQDPDICLDGTMEPQQCGLNGRGNQSRTCVAGQWGAFSACADPDVCEDGETRPCGPDPVGICQPGNQSCIAGQWAGECIGAIGPGNEVCGDALDNDCDGETNEGCPACQPNGPEVCDGVDNDCDGRTDTTIAAEGRFVIRLCTNQVEDTTTHLLWDRQASAVRRTQAQAAANCGAGKRLPTVDEARTIIAGCAATAPGGACQLSTMCNTSGCVAGCSCAVNPGELQGPGEGGCYWDLGVWTGACADQPYEWTATCGPNGCAASVRTIGRVDLYSPADSASYRCVSGP